MTEKGVVRRVIVTPDKHYPFEDKKAISVLVQTIDIVKPDAYIDLGDIGEWESVSHWQWKKKKRPPLEFQLPDIKKDITLVNAGMDIIDEALDKVNCKEKYFLQGNHDEWLDRFVEENPYLTEYGFESAVKLADRGYEYHKMGEYFKLGKMYYYHGHHYGGVMHTRQHLLKLGVNVMYGHWHDIQQYSLIHMDGAKSAWSIGCLKNMTNEKNEWLGGKTHNWSHAFAIVDYFNGGFFNVHMVQIMNGRTSLWGEMITA